MSLFESVRLVANRTQVRAVFVRPVSGVSDVHHSLGSCFDRLKRISQREGLVDQRQLDSLL
jgi:hypothetical protein